MEWLWRDRSARPLRSTRRISQWRHRRLRRCISRPASADARTKLLWITLTELRHLASLRQYLSSVVQMQSIHLAQLILCAELQAIERRLQVLVI
jgi:hypothetical protein